VLGVAAVGFRLGVDFGTSNTVAMLTAPDGRVRQLLVDGSPVLPSAVCLTPDGRMLVGRDAIHAARAAPEGFDPHPKRRIDAPAVRLGTTDVPVVSLIAAVLGRVAGEARRVVGAGIESVTMTYPAAWDRQRCSVLHAAAVQVGLGPIVMVPEPVAAAWSFLHAVDRRMPVGSSVVVYDFGGGTFDASVVRLGPGGFEVLASGGLPDTGGVNVDAAIVGYLATVYSARDPLVWRRLTEPATGADRRASRLLWDDVRSAKEMLSRQPSTLVHVPLLDLDAPIGREQFNDLARPILVRTVESTKAVLRQAGIAPNTLAGVFLVGGSSRIPLAATLLHQQLMVAPTVIESPELAVADGSLRAPRVAAPPPYFTAPIPVRGPAAETARTPPPIRQPTTTTYVARGAVSVPPGQPAPIWPGMTPQPPQDSPPARVQPPPTVEPSSRAEPSPRAEPPVEPPRPPVEPPRPPVEPPRPPVEPPPAPADETEDEAFEFPEAPDFDVMWAGHGPPPVVRTPEPAPEPEPRPAPIPPPVRASDPASAEPQVDTEATRRALRSVRTRYEGVTHQRGQLPQTLSTLRRRFVLSSFQDVDKLPARADREVRVAEELLRIAERHAESGDWAVVRTAIGDIRKALDNATAAIAKVTERLRVLDEIAADPKVVVNRARSVVRDAQLYFGSKGDAAQPVEGERLNSLSRRVDDAERAIKEPRADYWRISEELKAVRDETADVVRRIRGY
jgi:hypothetical protein